MHRCLATAIVPLLLLSACGEEEGAVETTSERPTTATSAEGPTTTTAPEATPSAGRAEFVAEADPICTRWRSELAALETELDEATSGNRFAGSIAAALPELDAQTDELAALPTASGSPVAGRLVERQREALVLLEGMEQAAEAEDIGAIATDARDLEELSEAMASLAARSGLEGCAAAGPGGSPP